MGEAVKHAGFRLVDADAAGEQRGIGGLELLFDLLPGQRFLRERITWHGSGNRGHNPHAPRQAQHFTSGMVLLFLNLSASGREERLSFGRSQPIFWQSGRREWLHASAGTAEFKKPEDATSGVSSQGASFEPPAAQRDTRPYSLNQAEWPGRSEWR